MFHLQLSKIANAGIGCFSRSTVAKGVKLKTSSDGLRRLHAHQIPDRYLKFCVLLACGRYLAPPDFQRMSAFWYINHAKHPNTVFAHGQLHALRTIESGEELTLYYSDLLTHPKNRLWVQPWDV